MEIHTCMVHACTGEVYVLCHAVKFMLFTIQQSNKHIHAIVMLHTFRVLEYPEHPEGLQWKRDA